MISKRSYIYRKNIIITIWSQLRVWLCLLEHTIVLACLYNDLFTNKRTTIPVNTPVNTSNSQSTTEQDYASSMLLWVNTLFLKLRFVALTALFTSFFKFEFLLTIHVRIKARTYTHTCINTQTQNYKILILQLDTLRFFVAMKCWILLLFVATAWVVREKIRRFVVGAKWLYFQEWKWWVMLYTPHTYKTDNQLKHKWFYTHHM